MVNATEMAKPFDKRPVDWLRLPSTNSFIEELSTVRKSHSDDYQAVKTINGGANPGTWMHEDVALEFARWLSPTFAIWCNDRIKELLKVGMTAMPQTVEAMLANPDLVIGLATQLKEERQKVACLAENNAHLVNKVIESEKSLKEAAPKVLFADCVTASKDTVLVRDLSTILKQRGVNIGQNRLFEWLRENDYLCSKGTSYNHPTQKSLDLKLFELIPRTIGDPGKEIVVYTTKVTGKGLTYFVEKFLYQKINPIR
jgi:phage antirepressor YoqD-like protein